MKKVNDILDKICKTLKDNKLYFEVDCFSTNGIFTIDVEWGDWKHDHLYLDHIMKGIGLIKIHESVLESDGSDCYSSRHFYQINN